MSEQIAVDLAVLALSGGVGALFGLVIKLAMRGSK